MAAAPLSSYADRLPAASPPVARSLSGLRLLFLFVLLEEGRGAKLLLLLGVGRFGGRALGRQRLFYLLAGAHRDLHALHAGGQLADPLGQLLVHVAVVVFAVH